MPRLTPVLPAIRVSTTGGDRCVVLTEAPKCRTSRAVPFLPGPHLGFHGNSTAGGQGQRCPRDRKHEFNGDKSCWYKIVRRFSVSNPQASSKSESCGFRAVV